MSDVNREPIKLKRVDIYEAVKEFVEFDHEYSDNLKIVNIRGTNASGKSTIPMQMFANDNTTYVLTRKDDKGKDKDVAMVFPKYGYVAIGSYFGKTGGLDRIRTTQEQKDIIDLVSKLPYNIVFEGILASTVFSTWRDVLLKHQNEEEVKRKAYVINLLPPFEVVKERLLKRNGGKEVKWEQVESKYRTVKKNATKFAESGLTSLEVDNSGITIEETLDWFFELVGDK